MKLIAVESGLQAPKRPSTSMMHEDFCSTCDGLQNECDLILAAIRSTISRTTEGGGQTVGTMLQLKCDECEHVRDIGVGFGMQSGVEHFYCARCGRMEERWIGVDEGDEAVTAPFCADHPKRKMRTLKLESEFDDEHGERIRTGVPCCSCGIGAMFGYQTGLWD